MQILLIYSLKADIKECMYIRMKTSKKAKYPTLQVVEGVREGKKVKQRTIAHLGMIKSQQDLQRLKNLADKLI
ncbi:hypothetical protein DB41_CT00090 [Neochlamydia sp. TUME1]|nr:hypothetical protein DB41_CT00090 [Neochlamydia sp. TUME1]